MFRIFLAFLSIFALVSCSSKHNASEQARYTHVSDLDGINLAINTGNASYENDLRQMVKNVRFTYLTNYFDTFLQVANQSADAAFVFYSFERTLQESFPGLYAVKSDIAIPIVAAFSKNANDLKTKFNLYVDGAKADGSLKELESKWIDNYPNVPKVLNFDELDSTNGTFKFGIPITNPPYSFYAGQNFAGFDVAVLYNFCKKSKLKPIVSITEYDAMVAGLSTGKYDMGMGAFGWTEERAKSTNFSKPYKDDYIALMMLDKNYHDDKSFFQSIKDSFYRNFIQEDRWKLILEGLRETLIITIATVALGTLAGFALFMAFRKNRYVDSVLEWLYTTLESLPVLVILMVFYYVVFGSSDLSGTAVSILVFATMFSLAAYDMLKRSTQAVPYGQTEAGLALGYTERETLFKIVLPQAAKFFMPEYKGAIVNYLKATAIVGYVAVQDLTKMGDIIRSRTFEAFFPLVTVALIYYIIARLLIFALDRVQKRLR